MGVRHASPGVMGAPPPVMMGASPGGVLRGGYPMATSVGRWDGGTAGGGVRGPHPAGPGPMSSMGAMGDGSWAPGGTPWTAPGVGGVSVDGGAMRDLVPLRDYATDDLWPKIDRVDFYPGGDRRPAAGRSGAGTPSSAPC